MSTQNDQDIATIQPSHIAIAHWLLLGLILLYFGHIWDNIYFIMGCLISVLIFFWYSVIFNCWKYVFDNIEGVLTERKGVFSVNVVEMKYFRIKSVKVYKPFLFRIFGVGNVEIISSEPFLPRLTLYAVHEPEEIAEQLKKVAAGWREHMGVKETDFHHF